MNEGKAFSDYINTLREKSHISLQALCSGLCTAQELSYLETGSRKPDMLLEDAILERLGVGAEDYERFLDDTDYQRWLDRHHILHSITFEKFEQAGQRLEEYRKTYCGRTEPDSRETENSKAGQNSKTAQAVGRTSLSAPDRLERQFYLSMLALLRRCQGASAQELRLLFEEALRLTVPDFDSRPLSEAVLSLKELNLLMETERFRTEGERPERYQEIIDYIIGRKPDRRGMTKIYPQAVYYLYRSLLRQTKGSAALSSRAGRSDLESGPPPQTRNRLLRHCNRALETLRDNGRMYFLWEILSMREALLTDLSENLSGRGNADTLNALCEETQKWKEALEAVYSEFHVPKETFEYCYLYVMKGCSCINDVIRIRRKMLGMTQEELCQGICSVKTIKRLESRRTSPQKAIVAKLFERLGLSGALTRTELVTGNPEATKLAEKISELYNRYRFHEADALFQQLKQLISVEIKSNQQNLLRLEILMQWKTGKLEPDEARKQLQTALELTVPYGSFLKEGEKYLTYEEQSCIQNMMQTMSSEEEEFLICMRRFEEIYQYYTDEELQETVAGMHELVIRYVGSMWGNHGEYNKADEHSGNILQGCLRFRRLWMICRCLYDRWWNYDERKKKGIPIEKPLNDITELTKCITFNRLAKGQNSRENFYRNKIEQIIQKGV